jgi:hypothetical protein
MTSTETTAANALSGGTGRRKAAKDSPSVRMIKLATGFCLIVVLMSIATSCWWG